MIEKNEAKLHPDKKMVYSLAERLSQFSDTEDLDKKRSRLINVYSKVAFVKAKTSGQVALAERMKDQIEANSP